ncbi:ribonuclease H-like domain-containing protein [Evansella cellulosilytica]|uniref:Tetratricopeptide TPR_1 repeat-containing protein n=1 Tax=Evansella cellulosilytica (strain ATCC 21833 / DSM 2522 / FERM P-1141 / JCM 9156 / N-4) TaxID=649639 RepID=E6U285_EVAC2|nr:ribonuclease H-like domain-containing protein [Evansella cellulosilytica]ADU30463.1 Tetratricopeptide TPR_1 repeat-containing protein [Evansella cellulosilytica DSM 2522]
MNLKSKLNRLKGHMQLEKESQSQTSSIKQVETPNTKINQLQEKWSKHGFNPFHFEEQTSYQKKVLYRWEKNESLSYYEVEEIHRMWNEATYDHPLSCKSVPLENMLFFDTETTGLSTGAGNSIFLIGYARVLKEGIEVTQHLLPDPASEVAFMLGFLKDFEEDDILVSYNGKAFDWPQVKSRHAFVRDRVPKLPKFGHIDLLHAARRLWKHDLPSCRLSIVEANKLGVVRRNDTPGSMAPLLYFDYVHDKNPDHLTGIIKHHDQDVRSLVHLYVAICNRLFLKQDQPIRPKEHVQIGLWFEQQNWEEKAIAHYNKAIELRGNGTEDALYNLALLLKKRRQYAKAKEYLKQSLSISSSPKIESFIELAKIAEHQEKDLHLAMTYVMRVKEQLKQITRPSPREKRTIIDVEKRLLRLKRKLG